MQAGRELEGVSATETYYLHSDATSLILRIWGRGIPAPDSLQASDIGASRASCLAQLLTASSLQVSAYLTTFSPAPSTLPEPSPCVQRFSHVWISPALSISPVLKPFEKGWVLPKPEPSLAGGGEHSWGGAMRTPGYTVQLSLLRNSNTRGISFHQGVQPPQQALP